MISYNYNFNCDYVEILDSKLSKREYFLGKYLLSEMLYKMPK